MFNLDVKKPVSVPLLQGHILNRLYFKINTLNFKYK